MISRYNAWIDGIALSSIHDRLYVADIVQEAITLQGNAAKLAKGSGRYLSSRSREALRVTIDFELHVYDPAARQAICSEIAAWAQGRILETSDRPGQELHVVCDCPPCISSAMRWTENISMVFTAYECPFWIDKNAKTTTVNNGNESLFVPGNVPGDVAKAKVDAVVTASGSMTSLTITAGDTSITLSGISLSSGDTVTFSHDGNGILSIKKGTDSLLGKRTAASSDDLEVPCGAISTFSSNRNCTFSVRGMWL